jgi:hypothetical protein
MTMPTVLVHINGWRACPRRAGLQQPHYKNSGTAVCTAWQMLLLAPYCAQFRKLRTWAPFQCTANDTWRSVLRLSVWHLGQQSNVL